MLDKSNPNENAKAEKDERVKRRADEAAAIDAMKDAPTANRDERLRLAKLGIYTFPGRPGTRESYKSAKYSNGAAWGKTIDPAVINADHDKWPGAMVCIACGKESNTVVLDADTVGMGSHAKLKIDGRDTLAALIKKHSPIPPTKEAVSPSGGPHIYFNYPKTGTIFGSVGKLGAGPPVLDEVTGKIVDGPSSGLDILSDGDMVDSFPTIKVKDGKVVGQYKMVHSFSQTDMPEWLHDELVALDLDKNNGERKPGEPQKSIELVVEALRIIPNDEKDNLSWDDWNTIGLATYNSRGGGDDGYKAFDAFSQKNKAKYNKADVKERWYVKYLGNPPDSAGFGKLWYLAKEACGYHWLSVFEEDRQKLKDNEDYADGSAAANQPPQDTDAKSDDILRLNKVHAVLPIGGKTRVVTFGEMEDFPGRETIVMTQGFGDFAGLQNKYRHEYVDKNGKPQEVGLGTYWLGHRNRRQYDGGQAFMPKHNKGKVGNKLNLWRGYGVSAVKPIGKSAAAGCDLFLEFMLNVMCNGNEKHFDYLRKREAVVLQQRMRCEVALGFRSDEEGVGKGFYEHTMGHLLGYHAMQISNPKHIIGAFNPHLETLLRLTADEALFAGNPEHRNTLFGLITEPHLTIEPKGCGVYRADSYLNLSVLSNAKHFVPISGTARRFFLSTVSPIHMQDHAYFKAIQDQLDDGGYEALLYYFLNEVDLTDFNVRLVPKTEGLMEQRDYSLSPLEAWWVELLESGTIAGADPLSPNKAVSNAYQREITINDNAFSGRQIRYVNQMGIFDQARQIEPRLRGHTSDHRLGSYLKDMGCENEKKVLRRRGWTFPDLMACRETWEKRFASWPWRDTTITNWRAEEDDDPVSSDTPPF